MNDVFIEVFAVAVPGLLALGIIYSLIAICGRKNVTCNGDSCGICSHGDFCDRNKE